MHDIWNHWHGCIKKSEGCDHCYMCFLDKMRDQDGSHIYRTKAGFNSDTLSQKMTDTSLYSENAVRPAVCRCAVMGAVAAESVINKRI